MVLRTLKWFSYESEEENVLHLFSVHQIGKTLTSVQCLSTPCISQNGWKVLVFTLPQLLITS